ALLTGELHATALEVDAVVQVVEVPAPLLAVGEDLQVRLRADVGELLGDLHRVEVQHPDHEDRHDGVHQLERDVVAQLDRQGVVVLPLPVGDDAPDDQAPHEDADEDGGDPGAVPVVDHRLGLVGDPWFGRQEAVARRSQLCATGEGEGRHKAQNYQSPPAGRAATGGR